MIKNFRLTSWLFLLFGIVLLFVGSAGVMGLFEKKEESPDYSGQEVPRDQIEAAYNSSNSVEEESAADNEGFIPFSVPLSSDLQEVSDMPTLEVVTSQDINEPEEVLIQPTFSPDDLESLQQAESEYEAAVVEENEKTIPQWIYIPTLDLKAPIIPAKSIIVVMKEDDKLEEFVQWLAPDEFAVGWHGDSAGLGEIGNLVLNGHHNAYGKVFRNLAYLQEGDLIQLYGGGSWYNYVVSNKMVLPEWDVTIERRLENAAWIMPSEDERLTLVTCWPEQTNTHRLIIVAQPVPVE